MSKSLNTQHQHRAYFSSHHNNLNEHLSAQLILDKKHHESTLMHSELEHLHLQQHHSSPEENTCRSKKRRQDSEIDEIGTVVDNEIEREVSPALNVSLLQEKEVKKEIVSPLALKENSIKLATAISNNSNTSGLSTSCSDNGIQVDADETIESTKQPSKKNSIGSESAPSASNYTASKAQKTDPVAPEAQNNPISLTSPSSTNSQSLLNTNNNLKIIGTSSSSTFNNHNISNKRPSQHEESASSSPHHHHHHHHHQQQQQQQQPQQIHPYSQHHSDGYNNSSFHLNDQFMTAQNLPSVIIKSPNQKYVPNLASNHSSSLNNPYTRTNAASTINNGSGSKSHQPLTKCNSAPPPIGI